MNAVTIRNISKMYRIYDKPQLKLKEALIRKLFRTQRAYHREFWALKDINLDFPKGSTIGIIGVNGSGKSTLLQIIVGILQPTAGTVEINGRIAALLELGAGFNPEFTGRENVFMSGAIMGVSKSEMESRFDEIVTFAGLENFIDQPVKIYSSGMYIRLAFAVSINVDPDILIIDEALSVGDARFQKKCYERLDYFKKNGKTIILVTHDFEIVRTFASHAVFLKDGCVEYAGDPKETVIRYLQFLFPKQAYITDQKQKENVINVEQRSRIKEKANENSEGKYCLFINPQDHKDYFGAEGAQIEEVNIYGLTMPNIFHGGEEIEIQATFSWNKEIVRDILLKENNLERNIGIGIRLDNKTNLHITSFTTFADEINIDPLENSSCIIDLKFRLPVFMAGDYFLTLAIAIGTQDANLYLKRYENMIHLYCKPNKKHVFGILDIDHYIRVNPLH